MTDTVRLELLYAVNPMCSWCYGFLPAVRAVRDRFGDDVRITLALGALRAETEPMRPEQKARLQAAWRRVEAASGQPFDHAIFARDDFAYDTRPASQGVMAARLQGPDAALDYLETVQPAFYRDGRDVTRRGELLALAEAAALDVPAFAAALEEGAGLSALERENHEVAALGITGYPTVVALGPRPRALTVGFRTAPAFLDLVATELAARAAA